jgi:hypothetical protein
MSPIIAHDTTARVERIADRLFPHQVEGVAFLLRRRRAILADDMGLGKTRQAIIGMHVAEPGGPFLATVAAVVAAVIAVVVAIMAAITASMACRVASPTTLPVTISSTLRFRAFSVCRSTWWSSTPMAWRAR